MGIGRKFERVIGAIERTFDVARHGVEPAHAARFDSGTTTRAFDDDMRMAPARNPGVEAVYVDRVVLIREKSTATR